VNELVRLQVQDECKPEINDLRCGCQDDWMLEPVNVKLDLRKIH